ncbi:TRAPP II complex, partial [Melampsora americana]
QADNVNGLIIIPHIGDQSFYLNRLMADFASDLIIRFRHLSSLLQSVSTLHSPHPSIHETIFDLLPLIPPLASSFDTHLNNKVINHQSTSSPLSSPSRANHPQKPLQSAPKARQPIAHLLNDVERSSPSRTSTPPASPRPQHNTHSQSLNSQSSNPKSLSPNLNSQSIQKPHRALSESLSTSQHIPTALNNPRPTSLPIDSRARKKLSGRIKKFDADLCLMIGELDEAVKLYTQAISISRTSNDLVWLASALEGLSLSKMMIHIHDQHQIDLSSTNTNTAADPGLDLVSLINEVIESYEQALAIYSKPMKLDLNSSDHLPPIIYVETGLRLLNIRGTLWKAQQESKPLHEGLLNLFGFKSNGMISEHSKVGVKGDSKKIDDVNLIPLTRHSISELASRVYIPELVTLVASDRIRSLTQLINWYEQIDFQRKSAWMKRELIGVMLQNLSHHQLHQQAENLTRLMNEIFKVYKVRLDDDRTKDNSIEEVEETGWLDIKIGLIKDGIILSEMISDRLNLLKLNLTLSKLLQCQIRNDENDETSHLSIMKESLKSMDQIPKLLNQVKMHEKDLICSTFFYAPHQPSTSLNSRSSKKIGTLVAGESVAFLITLQNPLLFELEISDIKLSTTGVHVSSEPHSIRIGPSSIKTIKLICCPNEVGSLFIKGVRIDLGSAVNLVSREFLMPMVLGNQKKKKEDQFMECLVVDQLPVLNLVPVSKNLVEKHLTIWDGEKVMIEFEIENESKVKVGWKEVEVIDDRQSRIRQELKRSSLSKIFKTEEIYHLEYELFHRPSLIVQDKITEEKVKIEVVGKIGVGSAQVSIRYGGLEEGNWMRECKEEIKVSVLKVLEIVDFLVWEDQKDSTEKCWVGIKVRNVLGNGKALEVGFDNVVDSVVGKQRIEAGSTVLIFTSIKKISLSESEIQVPIPSLDPNRQFIVASSTDQDEEDDHDYEKDSLARNEAFWIREKLLELIQVSWNEIGGIRNGELDLRSMNRRFDLGMVKLLRSKEIEISVLNLEAIECIPIEEFVEMVIRFTNRTR